MSPTWVDIDDELVALAMRHYRLTTKREAVDLALRELVGHALTADEALQMEGSGTDCLIAIPAIRAGAPVLHPDRDFEAIARHSALTTI